MSVPESVSFEVEVNEKFLVRFLVPGVLALKVIRMAQFPFLASFVKMFSTSVRSISSIDD